MIVICRVVARACGVTRNLLQVLLERSTGQAGLIRYNAGSSGTCRGAGCCCSAAERCLYVFRMIQDWGHFESLSVVLGIQETRVSTGFPLKHETERYGKSLELDENLHVDSEMR